MINNNEINFNMNYYIKVKFTEKGIEKLKESFGILDDFLDIDREEAFNSLYPVDYLGYTKIQMWDFMYAFGQELYIGNIWMPFEMDIKICVGEC